MAIGLFTCIAVPWKGKVEHHHCAADNTWLQSLIFGNSQGMCLLGHSMLLVSPVVEAECCFHRVILLRPKLQAAVELLWRLQQETVPVVVTAVGSASHHTASLSLRLMCCIYLYDLFTATFWDRRQSRLHRILVVSKMDFAACVVVQICCCMYWDGSGGVITT